jgi:hypothetical protein
MRDEPQASGSTGGGLFVFCSRQVYRLSVRARLLFYLSRWTWVTSRTAPRAALVVSAA